MPAPMPREAPVTRATFPVRVCGVGGVVVGFVVVCPLVVGWPFVVRLAEVEVPLVLRSLLVFSLLLALLVGIAGILGVVPPFTGASMMPLNVEAGVSVYAGAASLGAASPEGGGGSVCAAGGKLAGMVFSIAGMKVSPLMALALLGCGNRFIIAEFGGS